MALQRNYPVGNDISTQFLPASLSLGGKLLPQASRWRLCGPTLASQQLLFDPSGLRRWESNCYLISDAVVSLSLSQIECDLVQQAVKITDFWAVTEEDILWKLQVLMISYNNLEKCSWGTYDRQSDFEAITRRFGGSFKMGSSVKRPGVAVYNPSVLSHIKLNIFSLKTTARLLHKIWQFSTSFIFRGFG